MPLKVRRLGTAIFITIAGTVIPVIAQTASSTPSATPASAQDQTVKQSAEPAPAVRTPTSAEIMRERISKAKAYIVVRNYSAAIYELENIRRETSDLSVQSVTGVLLMHSYLEQGDYKRAQAFLNEAYQARKSNKPQSVETYSAVAGQIVSGARTRAERYRTLGLNITDRTLPLEAANDLDRMRETLELVVTQAKEFSRDTDKRKAAAALPLVEEAAVSRAAIARDDYDARRWRDDAADSREQMASSRSVIINAVDGTTMPDAVAAVKTPPVTPVANTPAAAPQAEPPAVSTISSASASPVQTPALKPVVETPQKAAVPPVVIKTPAEATGRSAETAAVPAKPEVKPASGTPLDAGSLITYATERSNPIYPAPARTARITGSVRVEVVIDEEGRVADVVKASGPAMLQSAAKDAIKRWKFKPFVVEGSPVKATGWVSFNFAL